MIKTPDEIRDLLRDRLFGQKVIQNNFRGELVEEIVASVIAPAWAHCSEDWSSWDFRRGRQLVQVRQAAARQSWDRDGESRPKRTPAFAIRPNSGYYIGSEWRALEKPERLAQIYIFAWHDDSTAAADHFDFFRWVFFVVPTVTLNEFDGDGAKGTVTVSQLNELVGLGKIKKVKLDDLLTALVATSSECPESRLRLDL